MPYKAKELWLAKGAKNHQDLGHPCRGPFCPASRCFASFIEWPGWNFWTGDLTTWSFGQIVGADYPNEAWLATHSDELEIVAKGGVWKRSKDELSEIIFCCPFLCYCSRFLQIQIGMSHNFSISHICLSWLPTDSLEYWELKEFVFH